MKGDGWFESDLAFEKGGVGVSLIDIPCLHREINLLCFLAKCIFQFADEVHQTDGMGTADIIDTVRNFCGRGTGSAWDVVEGTEDGFGDVVDVGEVAAHVAVVEYFDGLPFGDGAGEEHGRHIWTAPRTIDGEEAQASDRKSVEFRIAVGLEFS